MAKRSRSKQSTENASDALEKNGSTTQRSCSGTKGKRSGKHRGHGKRATNKKTQAKKTKRTGRKAGGRKAGGRKAARRQEQDQTQAQDIASSSNE